MTRFNAGVRLGEELSLNARALPHVTVKNVGLARFLERYPEYLDVTEALRSMLPEEKRFLTISVWSQHLKKGANTCVNTGWHLDGKMNPGDLEHYALVCFADDGLRTMFHGSTLTVSMPEINSPVAPDGRDELFQQILKHDLHDESFGWEIPNATPVGYSALDFHKGRQSVVSGHRTFVRLMTSNAIRPHAMKHHRR